ncbi:MAG: hypothetical protein BHV81_07675 [Butyricimonas synergistica]|nr:MAG: hypothetical protein BHV81_07675 [Butyricimonas synergistica]
MAREEAACREAVAREDPAGGKTIWNITDRKSFLLWHVDATGENLLFIPLFIKKDLHLHKTNRYWMYVKTERYNPFGIF